MINFRRVVLDRAVNVLSLFDGCSMGRVALERAGIPVNQYYASEIDKYAIQISVADSWDGACSSSTLKEASSWGKVDITKEQMVFAEATSVLPLIISDAYHRAEWKNRERKNFSKIFG